MEKVSLEEMLSWRTLAGKVIVFPTDTVYGLAALATDDEAIARIFALKGRPRDKKLPVLVASLAQAERHYGPFPEAVRSLLSSRWPGAFTLVVPVGASDSVGLRMPDSAIALRLLERFGPLSTTSVNLSGAEELNSVASIETCFPRGIDAIVTDRATFSGTSSTVAVIDRTGIRVVRKGDVVLGPEEQKIHW